MLRSTLSHSTPFELERPFRTCRRAEAGGEQRRPGVQDVLRGVCGAGQRGERRAASLQAGQLCLQRLQARVDARQALCRPARLLICWTSVWYVPSNNKPLLSL